MYCQKCMKNMITSHGETCPVCKTQIANANDLRIKAVIRRGRRNQVPLATRILFALFVLTLTTVFIGVFLFQNAIRPSHQTHRLGSPINVRGATIASGSRHAAVIRADGELWAWGGNFRGFSNQGELGDGTKEPSLYPIQVGIYTDWVSAAAGSSFTIATRADGSLWVWGRNPLLYFGIAQRDVTVPTQIQPYEHWVSVAAGGNNRAFGVTQEGRVVRLG